eukprot:2172839-Prymnesium_polylepis.2
MSGRRGRGGLDRRQDGVARHKDGVLREHAARPHAGARLRHFVRLPAAWADAVECDDGDGVARLTRGEGGGVDKGEREGGGGRSGRRRKEKGWAGVRRVWGRADACAGDVERRNHGAGAPSGV